MNIIVEIISIFIGILLWVLIFQNKEKDAKQFKVINLIDIYIEQIDEIYYAWHNKNFIFQTKDTKELITYIRTKFPNNIIKITSDKELAWLQEVKKELNLN
jgi:hypothetical protein